MKQAELIITLHNWGGSGSSHCVNFASTELAKQEFYRISGLLKKRGDRGNDLPKFLDVEGGTNELTCNFDQIVAVAMVDLKKADDDAIGIKDAYPHLNWLWQRP